MRQGSRLRFLRHVESQDGFRTGVSLHSHTCASRESLDFIPRICGKVPLLRTLERAYRRRYEQIHGLPLDYMQSWWTPPLTPPEALQVESRQIESLGLQPLVSLSDHDTLEGIWSLRARAATHDALLSVEWTVPFEASFFHLGVHNLPPASAAGVFDELADYTARPDETKLRELLVSLNRCPDVLVVFNHPMWDEKSIGQQLHVDQVYRFLSKYKLGVHALELNGLRPWKENRSVIRLAMEAGLPLISGGDRHGLEPNANLNVTNATSFPAFVEEIRVQRASDIVFLPQYQQSLPSRIIDTLCDVMRSNPNHGMGWHRWSDRVFHRETSGVVRPLSAYWDAGGGTPALVRAFISTMRIVESRRVRSAMRPLFGPQEELAW
jgi:hypothetical protein